MAAVLNTNMASLYAQKNLSTAQASLAASVQRLSSGTRINSAKDDAAGVSLANSVQSVRNITDQLVQNTQNAISLIQTADGALDAVGKILQRALSLTQQKLDGTLTEGQKTSIDNEVNQLLDEITRIKERTTFNGAAIFGKDYSFSSGPQANTNIHIADLSMLSLGLSSFSHGNPSNFPSYIPSSSDGFSLSQLGASTNNSYVVDTGFIKFTVNGTSEGTIGNGNSSPGLMYDASGTGNYGVDDYIQPGTPWEMYNVNAGSNTIGGNNTGEDYGGGPAQIWQINQSTNHYVVLKGDQNSGFVTTQYMAKPGESFIRMRMSYTNTTGSDQPVTMVRGMDPDVDVQAYGIFDTLNTLGANGNLTHELVNGIGQFSGKSISLFIPGNDYTHNVAISWWTTNPSDVLAGGADTSISDDTIEGAWDFGTVANGQTVSVDAYYICGNNVQQTIDQLSNTQTTDLTSSLISDAISINADNRASLGAQLNELNYQIDSLQTMSSNLTDGISRVVDTDYAAETANLTKSQILQQAATSMLAQANQMPNVVLSLLK